GGDRGVGEVARVGSTATALAMNELYTRRLFDTEYPNRIERRKVAARMPLPALKIAILHYQPKGDEVDPVVTQLSEALGGLGHQVTTVAVDDRVSEILRDTQRAK